MSSPSNPLCYTPLSSRQTVGLAFTTGAGVASVAAVLLLFFFVIRNAIRYRRNPVRMHIDLYMLSLLAADLVQGIGAMLDVHWVRERSVQCGGYCNAQGSMKVIGEAAVGLSTLAVTIHTFFAIFFRWSPPKSRYLPLTVISLIWLYTIGFAVVGMAIHPRWNSQSDPSYFTPVPYWCWINSKFSVCRLLGKYFWLWFTAFLNIVSYILLFYHLRGNIQTDPSNWTNISFVRKGASSLAPMDGGHSSTKDSLKMLWYPLSYTILILPLSISRWSEPHENLPETYLNTRFASMEAGIFIFGLSGLVNVLLFWTTRPSILGLGLGKPDKHGSSAGTVVTDRRMSTEVGHAPEKQGVIAIPAPAHTTTSTV